MCTKYIGTSCAERLVLGMKKPPRTRRHEGEVSYCFLKVAVTVYCPADRYWLDSGVSAYLVLNTPLVFTALFTVLLEYLTGYLESLNDYPVSLGYP
jgi:hypothetical protein